MSTPKALQAGDHLRVIAPARSLPLLSQETISIATASLQKMGLTVSFGKNVHQADQFMSSSVDSRIEDLHQAFADPDVDGILTVIGGFNSNQILKSIDWQIIANNPKVFCGFSDITALNTAIHAKTGLINFSGPHFSTFGQKYHLEYTQAYFQKMVMDEQIVSVDPSKSWTDDEWWLNQEQRNPIANQGYWKIQEGSANCKILGGNLGTLALLFGTEFAPDFSDSIVFIEDTATCSISEFDRLLQALLHQPGADKIKGLVIGRFQQASKIDQQTLKTVISSKPELADLPVLANVDFGHTEPKITLPIGGQSELVVSKESFTLKLLKN